MEIPVTEIGQRPKFYSFYIKIRSTPNYLRNSNQTVSKYENISLTLFKNIKFTKIHASDVNHFSNKIVNLLHYKIKSRFTSLAWIFVNFIFLNSVNEIFSYLDTV